MIYDKDIREPLFDYLEDYYGRIRIIEEKTLEKSRADVLMVMENAICGIEIKSDADTYARLEGQVEDYDLYFDYNLAVVGSSHAMHIREHLPAYWGVITVEEVDGALDFYMLRKPEPVPKTRWQKKLELLWRPELAEIQACFDMPKYKEKSKHFVIGKIADRIPEKISEEELRRKVSELLFERDYTSIEDTLREYRKGELTKKIEQTRDPLVKIELMMQRAVSKSNILKGKRKIGRRRRK